MATSTSSASLSATTAAHIPAVGHTVLNEPASPRSALLLQLALINLLALALVAVAWREGYVQRVFEADETGLSAAIVIVFVAGLALAGWRALQINSETDTLETGLQEIPPPGLASLRMRLAQRIAAIRHIANTLVLLGLIGTVLGFIIALSGVDPEHATDVAGIAPMVSTLIQGMSTALYTTLIGSILNVWLMANYQFLSGATVHLMSLWLDRTDDHART